MMDLLHAYLEFYFAIQDVEAFLMRARRMCSGGSEA